MYLTISVLPISITSGVFPPASVASNFWRWSPQFWYWTSTVQPGWSFTNCALAAATTSGQPDCASTWSHTVNLFAEARSPLALAVAATTPSATAATTATKTFVLIHVSLEPSTRRRGLRDVRRSGLYQWPRRVYRTPDRSCQVVRSALRAAELGDDPVPVAPVDRLDEFHRPAGLVVARALEEEGGRVQRHAERRRLLFVRHRRLDRLGAA